MRHTANWIEEGDKRVRVRVRVRVREKQEKQTPHRKTIYETRHDKFKPKKHHKTARHSRQGSKTASQATRRQDGNKITQRDGRGGKTFQKNRTLILCPQSCIWHGRVSVPCQHESLSHKFDDITNYPVKKETENIVT